MGEWVDMTCLLSYTTVTTMHSKYEITHIPMQFFCYNMLHERERERETETETDREREREPKRDRCRF